MKVEKIEKLDKPEEKKNVIISCKGIERSFKNGDVVSKVLI